MKWTLDTHHTSIEFAVTHMAIATVRGYFRGFSGTAETNDQGELTSVTGLVDTSSVDTNAEQRDTHLRSADFFDSANYPQMTFQSTRIEMVGARSYRVHGDLTIRGVAKPVVLEVETGDVVRDPWGNQRTGAQVTARINRRDWGLNWNVALELGGVLVSDEVRITIDAQATADRALAAA